MQPSPEWDVWEHLPGRGVARSRNRAIDLAGRRYLLFADDDVRINVPGVVRALALMRANGAAVVTGRAVDPSGQMRKRYGPRVMQRLTRLNAGKAATYEMLIDVDKVRESGVRFDERFGAGVDLHLGDEYIFIADLLRAGLKGYAAPYIFAVHPEQSSGSAWTPHDAHVRLAIFDRVFGRAAPAARLAFAARHHQRLGGAKGALAFTRGKPVQLPPPEAGPANEGLSVP